MTTKKPTGFDSFFEAVSSTPEYKTIMNGMSKICGFQLFFQEYSFLGIEIQ